MVDKPPPTKRTKRKKNKKIDHKIVDLCVVLAEENVTTFPLLLSTQHFPVTSITTPDLTETSEGKYHAEEEKRD